MLKSRALKAAFAVVISCTVHAAPVFANPGNGNGGGGQGNGNSGNPGNNGISGEHGNKGHGNAGPKEKHGNRKNAGRPDHVESDINYSLARKLAVNYGLVGYQSLPPGIAKKVARGKPLPPGIAKKSLPASMLNELPYYPGYEWRSVGDNLVLITLSTAVVTAVINGVFD
ncbi:anti-virulence regulator CigR family protein [Pantoea agglomerans]|uniref:anti-virulence regulator CigR family protein n=1 Tax=Enterobacter agglomerans TaxID=549 RepID=UPI002A6A68DA|nr:anti-virulence regulator CigR family protein [Pantoea agglomerans]MDY0901518.1 anti-virulence regulator CigR family protein [Pantoea agglomerans]